MSSVITTKRSSLTKLYLLPMIGKFLIALFLFLLICAGGIAFLYGESATQLTQIKVRRTQLEKEVMEDARSYSELSFFSKNTQFTKKQYGDMIQLFPPGSKVGDLLADITKLGTADGLKFIYFKPQAEVISTYYAIIPVEVSVVGQFHQIGNFLSGIASLPNAIVTVNQFSITRADNQLSLTFTASLYHALPNSLDIKI